MTSRFDKTFASAAADIMDEFGDDAVYTFLDETTKNIKADFSGMSRDREDDGTGEFEIAAAEVTVLTDTDNCGIAAPEIGEQITYNSKVWLIISIIEATSYDTRMAVRWDKAKSKQYEQRIKKIK